MKAIDSLSNHDAVTSAGIAVAGFSMGGHWALWLAQRPELPITATVVFYAVRAGDFRQSKSRFLFHFAEDDDWVSAAGKKKVRRCLEVAGRDAAYYRYARTRHWFFESNRSDVYQPEAADMAWRRTLGFLQDAA